ncbi:MAG: flavodoxin [Clostridiales bacterium]|nr:flavodoxin [Clostridiales bacterium]
MKRWMVFALSICMIMILASCNSGSSEIQNDFETTSVPAVENQPVTENESGDTSSDTDATDRNILVAYFSCTGTTEQIAEWIVSETDADIYEIVAADPYTDEDLNYNNSSCRANQEQADSSAHPEINGEVEDISRYDIIFLGYPIWHGQAPKIIYTFLESYDSSDVTIIPFCTSHSSGIGSSAENLHSLCDDSVT